MIDDHEIGLRLRRRIRPRLPGIRFLVAGAFKAFARLRFTGYRHRSDDACPAGHRREFLKPPFAEHRPAADFIALLRDRADDVVTERVDQAAQFLDARGMRDVIDIRDLDADEDRARNGWFGLHDTALAGSFWCLAYA